MLTAAGGGGLALLFAQSDDIRQKKLHEKDITPEAMLSAKKTFFSWWFMDADTGGHVGSAPGAVSRSSRLRAMLCTMSVYRSKSCFAKDSAKA